MEFEDQEQLDELEEHDDWEEQDTLSSSFLQISNFPGVFIPVTIFI